MSIFSKAHNFQVFGGEFHSHFHSTAGIDLLLTASTPEAAVESEEVYKRTCFPGTREQYITDITNWAATPDDIEPIYWMRGPAGVGKSSVATTCAQNLQATGHLGAAFFFSVNGRRSDHTRLFPTLAYQLSTLFPEYRDILNQKVSSNKTIIKMSMPSQFRSLIVEPLQELGRQDKPIGKRTIFIDGLDECKKKDAQAEIIEIIAESVRSRSTSFHWAIFSREEPSIVSTFGDARISPLCRSVYLPISRDVDDEVELYLRNEFRHVLKRRNLLDLASSWPKDEDIRKLVNAAAGLFAHPAAVVRFVDSPLDWRIQERLEAVLNAILRPNDWQPVSPFAELDAFYMLVMHQIPPAILPSLQLLICQLVADKESAGEDDGFWNVASCCAMLQISELEFRHVCQQLHAVLHFRKPVHSLTVPHGIDVNRSCFDQDFSFELDHFGWWILEVHGRLGFYHKSFYDFLIDPARSSTFCVTTPAVRERLFDCLVQQHLQFSSSYTVDGSKLVLAPGVPSSSSSLSWPYGCEFVDSFLKLQAFCSLSAILSQDNFDRVADKVSPDSLRKLAELDYHKDLVAEIMDNGTVSIVVGHRGSFQSLPHTIFECLQLEDFEPFDSIAFLEMVEKLEKAGIIRPYYPQLGSSHASVIHTFSQREPQGESNALYEFGHGARSVIWYWEFDTKERYFHQFRTTDLEEAIQTYIKDKFAMWEESWVAPL